MFCVYLTIYHGNKMPMFYIGSTSLSRIEKQYRGTVLSKEFKDIWNEELKTNPQLFKTVILKEFNIRKEALDYEYYIQKKRGVVKNKFYINKSLANINGFFGMDVSGPKNPNYKRPWSDEERKQQSDRMLARWRSDNPPPLSIAMIGDKKGEKNPNYGNYWSEDQRDKLRGANNGMFGSTLFVGVNNPMYGSHGQKHPRARIYVIQDMNGIIYEVYDRIAFKKLFGIDARDVCLSMKKKKNKRRKWKGIEILPKDPSKTEVFSIRS